MLDTPRRKRCCTCADVRNPPRQRCPRANVHSVHSEMRADHTTATCIDGHPLPRTSLAPCSKWNVRIHEWNLPNAHLWLPREPCASRLRSLTPPPPLGRDLRHFVRSPRSSTATASTRPSDCCFEHNFCTDSCDECQNNIQKRQLRQLGGRVLSAHDAQRQHHQRHELGRVLAVQRLDAKRRPFLNFV